MFEALLESIRAHYEERNRTPSTTAKSTPPPPREPAPAAEGSTKPAEDKGPSPFKGMFEGEGTHPLVQQIVDNPGAKDHEKQVEQAKEAVVAVNAARAEKKSAEMTTDNQATVVEALVIGGGVQGTLDAATHPAEAKDTLGIAMGPDPWSTYGHMRVGQTGNQLAPHQPGDPTQEKPGLKGMAVQPAALHEPQVQPDPNKESDPKDYLRSSELALATAETQRQSGVPFVTAQPVVDPATAKKAEDEGKKVGPIQLRPTDEEAAKDWPPGATAKVTVKMTDPDGKEHLETIFTTGTMDVAVGPGPSRKLGATQIAPNDAKQLESWGPEREDGTRASPQLMYAEQFLGTPGAAEGQEVMVYGGGDTGAWCAETAKLQGAKSSEWAARPGKPPTELPDPNDPKKKVRTEFGECEERIRKAVESGKAVDPADQQEYASHMSLHRDQLQTDVHGLDDQIKAMEADPANAAKNALELAKLREQRDKKKQELAPHDIAKPRNEDITKEDDSIKKTTGDVLNVKPDPDGSGKVLVTMIDVQGNIITRKVDKFVGAIGQDANAATGPRKMLEGVENMDVIWDGDIPVGLQSNPEGVRVLGSSAFAVMDKITNVKERAKYQAAIRQRSLTKVSADSRGVDIGFENMGDNPARANEVLARQTSATKPEDDKDGKEAAEELTKEAKPAAAVG